MTDQEWNRFACNMAEPLWDLGYEVNWQHEEPEIGIGWTHFRVGRGFWKGGIILSRAFMEQIRSVEVAQRHFVRLVERELLIAVANEPDYPAHNHEEFTSSSPDYYGC